MSTSIPVLALTLGIAFIVQSSQKASPQFTLSSYQKSCSNIKVEDGNLLSATCLKIDGSPNNTSIRIPEIENINGVLIFNNLQNSSTYQKSCSNIKVEEGNLLSATCLKIDGSPNNTSIHIPGIENINGVLTFNNLQNSSTYQKSCSNIKVEEGNLLSATCLKIDGSPNNTSIHIPGIENINGVLMFSNDRNSSTYQKSCSNIKVEDGNLLSATCLKIDGSPNNTSIRIPGIENINGVLTFNNLQNSSTYQKSCSNIKVEDGNLLSATCLKIDGSPNNTSIRIPGIENINGVLMFK
ncbi:CVNH domain-containing protein [Aetokthonos hydrillicola Thurmond2011]|uniref:CVNH domain-containing protein n=1 Tax=Aetokthonos hydrillicola Thurmond2011 TaxID=2712845 RepID=A0AAP5M6Z0_9CYAN|nr:hypothetical protein [Aetokthonos hydrillicola CCALA 1050]MBW4585675.1 CVNH domain-containing protein [Aetokthonos hydrillicola CCALA 1050]MDR9894575.1 CVNH domain-containing protein [Aetokthonos hydrillicola Thurmond2011]